jgi:hypothetical protein
MTTENDISDTVYYFEDWNGGLGKKYILTTDFTKPIPNPSYEEGANPVSSAYDKIRGYEDLRTEVPR